MQFKRTAFLLGLALLLFAFIFFFERHTPDSEQRARQAVRLFPPLNPALVSLIEIKTSNETMRAEQAGAWRITAPRNYPARSLPIEHFVQSLNQLNGQFHIPAAKAAAQPHGLADFGLAPPQTTVTLQQGTNRLEIRFGSPSALGGKLYFQIVGDADVYATEAAQLEKMPRSANDWRDTALVNLESLKFNRLEVRLPGRGFEVRRDTNGPWSLTKPLVSRADNPKLENLLQQINQWHATQFVSDDPQIDLEPYGLVSPETELVFGQGTNDTVVVQFGKSPTNDSTQVYARRLAHTNLVLVPRAVLETLRTPFSEWRDRKLVAFSPAEVDLIEIRGDDQFSLRRVTNQTWRVNEPLNFPADSELVQEFLAQLGELQISEFVKDVVTDYSSYGLATPRRQFVLKRSSAATPAADQIVAQVDFGTNQLERIFARRPDESSVYAVSYRQMLGLPQAYFQLRDRRLWDFSSSNVTSIAIQQQGRQRKLTRDASGQWIAAAEPGAEVNPFAVEETLHRLGQLKVERWIARGEQSKALLGIPQTQHVITVELSGEKGRALTLELGPLSRAGRPYGAVLLDGEAISFEFSPELHQDLLRDLSISTASAAR